MANTVLVTKDQSILSVAFPMATVIATPGAQGPPGVSSTDTSILQTRSEKDQPGGYAGLDATGKILDTQLPTSSGGVTGIADVPGLQAALDSLQDRATAATDTELSDAVATLNAAIGTKQDASTAATDAELADAVATINTSLAAINDTLDTKQDSATAATDAELADAVATINASLSAISSSSFIEPPATDSVFYVSGTGSDTNDGLTQGNALRTLAAAYAALPSAGGTIFIGPGRYDVGTGLALDRGKPASFIGLVKPPPYVTSTLTAPLTLNCAILYTSSGAVSMVTTTGGTASSNIDGLKFEKLLFEFSNPATKYGVEADSARYGEIVDCYGFADKTTGPAAVDAALIWCHGSAAYADSDPSWWRVHDNHVINMALAILGNPTGTKYNSNQHVVRENVGLGLAHTNTSALPFVSMYGCHRTVVENNNIEAYNRGVLMDSCWQCRESGDGGEFVDIMVDLINTKGCYIAPIGSEYAPLGTSTPLVANAMLVRGDTFSKANVIDLQATWTSGNTQRMYPPADDPTAPSLSLGSPDNTVRTYRPSDFEKGATIVNSSGVSAQNVVVWRAPFRCTVAALKGWRTGGTGATVNASKGTISAPTSKVLASDLSLTSADTWTDGGTVQNITFNANDPLIINVASVAGSPTEVGVQVEFRRV